tara:strand:- start:360 stop:632 length:273 start_codon:yes stop_codon:yes gene_type:complete
LLRTIADTILEPVQRATGLPEGTVQGFVEGTSVGAVEAGKAPKGKKKTAYQRAYKRAFKRVSNKYKKKDGTWRKGGFKAAVREAHKVARK